MRISIVIPSFNQARFIEEAIRSVLDQETTMEIELIIIDAGSTDGTVEILQRFHDRLAFWVSEKDRGQSHALNKGFALATGEIMAWLCADDFYLPGAFATVEAFFRAHPEQVFCSGNGYLVDAEGSRLRPIRADIRYDENGAHRCDPEGIPIHTPTSSVRHDLSNLVNNNYVFSTAAFWKRSLWDAAGGYIDEHNFWTMDWELFIRMQPHGHLQYLKADLACLRTYPETKTASGMRDQTAERNREIVRVSRTHGGWFCYNSLIYPLVAIAELPRHCAWLPRPLHAIVFRLAHLPLRLRSKHRRSMLVDNPDGV